MSATDKIEFIKSQVEIAERYAAANAHGLACSSCLWGSLRRFDSLKEKYQAVVFEDMRRIVAACAPALTPNCKMVLSFLQD